MIKSALSALSLGLLLSACASGGTTIPPSRPQTVPKVPVRTPGQVPPPRPQVQVAPGLERVIGATGADLTAQFGPARLEVWEGDARKLQFSGTACVLDIYLYPPAPGREPQATYVEARRASDGQDVDRAACIAALRRR
ncbi:MAG TPA: hypothetical protein PK680_00390 [Novosphingobium sp.]|nr:hypothetical protein [Novosphingobium sp.]HQA16815.1 hypothetical protein [Novosphingobium sp.]